MTNVLEHASSASLKRSERVVALSLAEKEACLAFHATIVDFYSGDGPPHIAKPTVYDLLYGVGPKAIMEESKPTTAYGKPFHRWHHLPANNITWCKNLISKIYEDAGVSTPFGINEDWTKREHRGMTAHSRFIRPTTREIPSLLSPEGRNEGTSSMMLFMPFITLEAARRVSQFGNLKNPHSPQLGSPATYGQRTGVPDTILTLAYPNLHIRRTLDQYFYTSLENTAARDNDQTIYRWHRQRFRNQEPKIIVVDQLWLWILNKEWIVSSFLQRGDHSIIEGDVLDSILHYLTSPKLGQISTGQELAALITSHCIDSFNYDLGAQAKERSAKIVDTYDETLQMLSMNVSRLYGEAIHSTIELNHISNRRKQEKALTSLVSRASESQMLNELRDIRDELEIILLLQDDQIKAIRDMGTTIGRKEDQNVQLRYKRLRDEIDDQVADVANLHKLAARISVDVGSVDGFTFTEAKHCRSTKSWNLSKAPLLQMKPSTLSLLAARWQGRVQNKGRSSCSSRL
ncbi:hypothetical protein B0O99DRAFT_644610 [Bisporella sp. PMI_857]|nr:hypothetical protein B0O99DRAFT_644610 [Bisporella sp. PMI_857]